MPKIIKKLIRRNRRRTKTCKSIENENEYSYIIYFGKNAINADTLK